MFLSCYVRVSEWFESSCSSIIVANKTGRIVLKRLTRADPYNIKNDLLGLNVHAYKNYGKNAIHETVMVMKRLLLYQKQQDGNLEIKG